MTVRSATATFVLATIAAILTAGQAAAQSPGTSPAPSSGTPPAVSSADAVKGFSIVLVEGSLQPGSSLDLPAPARAAIEDIKDFLPFKSFRLLDASWMVGATDVRSRLAGGDRNYDAAVTVTRQAGGKDLAIRFTLRDVTGTQALSAPEPEEHATVRRLADIATLKAALQAEYANLEALRQKYAADHPSVRTAEESIARSRDRLAILERVQADSLRQSADNLRRLATGVTSRVSAATLIDTSFSMRIGETVVVGTSRVNGERALIALMTAVPKDAVGVRRQF
jgi:hypothetical protein